MLSSQLRNVSGRNRLALVAGAVLLFLFGLAALWMRNQGAERRALSELPADERAALYRHDLDSFRVLCGQGPRKDALEKRCADSATFILQFPECDDDCRKLAQSHLPTGTR